MKIFLAGPHGGYMSEWWETNRDKVEDGICILESFYYMKKWMPEYVKKKWDFILDSGAFTYMQLANVEVDWKEYIDRYADYVIEHDIKQYF